MCSPQEAKPYQNQRYDDLKEQLLESGSLFEDRVFPARDRSVFFQEALPFEIEWLRPSEIIDDPQFVVDGSSRLDIVQGQLGDCWLLAATAALSESPRLFERVAPMQSFTDDYCGMFRFRFWRFGEWIEVVIDDRLPTYNGQLVFMQSAERNEFWSPLLEKAYAKLHGSYETLKGGNTIEAMEDFTGGVSEIYDLQELPEGVDLFETMYKAHKKGSLMGCSLNTGEVEGKQDNGLISGHAYTITGVCKAEEFQLIRCRNPWGNEAEWNGAWSDASDEWNNLEEETREEMGLTKDHDGEFWMSVEDFQACWSKLEVCNLTPECMADDSDDRKGWSALQFDGRWQKNVSAGGCRNFPDTFYINPQILISLEDVDDDADDVCSCIVAVMQKDRRKGRQFNLTMLTVGMAVYACEEEDADVLEAGRPLPKNWFLTRRSAGMSTFINTREVTHRFSLPPGKYVIVPSTFNPKEQGDFVVRVFSEKEQTAQNLDEQTEVDESQFAHEEEEEEEREERNSQLYDFFKSIAGENFEIDAFELKSVLTQVFQNVGSIDFSIEALSSDTCKALIAMMDEDGSGQLGFEEFSDLWRDLLKWLNVFKQVDVDGTGYFNLYELRAALQALGFRLNSRIFNSIAVRFGDEEGRISFDDFMQCIARLKKCFVAFRNHANGGAEATFTLEQYIRESLYQ